MNNRNKLCMLSRTKNHSLVLLLLLCTIGFMPLPSLCQPLAAGKDKFLGNCLGNKIYNNFDDYWNQVTPGNAGKWGSVEYAQDSYNWTPLDNIYNYAVQNKFLYKHHTLVWGNQQPSWITALDSAAQRAEVEEWIHQVGARYPSLDFVDVVNEPLHAPPSYANALGGNGGTGWDWVVTSFQWARNYCASGAKLLINEYNILHSNSATDDYLAIISLLKERNLIDGIGIQGHYFEFKSYAGASSSYSYSISAITYNLNRLVATGLPVYVSEFDINEADDNVQLQNYQTYFPIFWENVGVKGMTLWGYMMYDTWQTNAYLVTDRGKERPAMQWLRSYLASPLRPVLISPNAVTISRDPQLLWHASESATSYQVQLSISSTFSSLVVDSTIADTLLQLSPLEANRRYFWHVRATNEYGSSFYSTTASFMTNDQITNVNRLVEIPRGFQLSQNYPNPFNSTTAIAYSLPHECVMKLQIYNLLGQEIKALVNGSRLPGRYTAYLHADELDSGIYFYKMKTDDFEETRRMIVIK